MPQDLEMQRIVHPDDLRMAARDQQAEERELRATVVAALHLDEMGKDMSLQVIDFDDRLARGDSQSLGERGPHQQRAQQAGAARKGDGIDLVHRHFGPAERLRNDRQDILLVRPGSQFGNHTSILAVDLLGGHHVGEEVFVAQDGGRGVVAGRFDSEDNDCHRLKFAQK